MPVFAIDVFCGAGGMSLGLLRAGVPVLAGIDNDALAADTYEQNLGIPVIRDSVENVTGRMLRHLVPAGGRLVFAICAPCQPFSKVRTNGKRSKGRDLLLSVGRLVRSARPDGLVVENVPQIGNGSGRGVLGRFTKLLASSGYSYTYANLDAKNFDVPQTRRRMVLLAVKGKKELHLPRSSGRRRTVRDAIGDLPRINAGERRVGMPLHRASRLAPQNLVRLRATPRNGGDSRAWPADLLPPCRKDSDGFYDVYGRMRWEAPAPTLTTRCNSLSNGRFGHPEQDRAISLLEAALLQTFPRSYRFAGVQNEIAKQIGNAVPVRLAAALAGALAEQL